MQSALYVVCMLSTTAAYGTDLWHRNKTVRSVHVYWLFKHVCYISCHWAVPYFFRSMTEIERDLRNITLIF